MKRAPLFIKQGMQVQYTRAENYEGNPEQVLWVDPEHLAAVTLGDPMKGPMYEYSFDQKVLMHILASKLGARQW